MAAIVTVCKHKLYVGAYPTWRGGGCSRCFSWSTWSGLPKKARAAFATQGKIPHFQPQNPENLGDYGKSSSEVR